MGTGNLTDRSIGQTILDTFFNDIHGALDGDFVGRNATGIATSGQNLGTVAVPWGTIRAGSLVLGGSSIDTSQITAQVNRVTSGKTRTTSNQPAFITPNGAALSLIVAGATTNLVVDINGSAVSVTTNITKSSLTAAPSSNNTCTVNDAAAAGGAATRTYGEVGSPQPIITVSSMGSNITSLVGTYQAFKIGSEYFIAFVKSTTQLTKCYRGCFYDSSLAPVNRSTFSNGATITLMKLGYVFITNDGVTVDVVYNTPKYQVSTPAAPTTGDYWYDLANNIWKRYDGATFQTINRTLIGMFVSDSTNTVAARCVPFYASYKVDDTVDIEVSTTEIVQGVSMNSHVSVQGNTIRFGQALPTWNITTMLAASADMYNATEQASTTYYCYVKDTGDLAISDISPYHLDGRMGSYHPHNPWRCVGQFYNDGSSNIVGADKQFVSQQKPKRSLFTKLTAASGTFVRSPGSWRMRIEAAGAGGGGGGSGTSGGGIGGAGTGNTTLGTSLLVCNPGNPGDYSGSTAVGGTGGSFSLGTAQGYGFVGGKGQGANSSVNNGGMGGANKFGGAGAGGFGGSSAGSAAAANSGGGGGGAGAVATGGGGGGGGAGGFLYAEITDQDVGWADAYPYTVGVGGTAGAAGTSGQPGGAGANGGIYIWEDF